MDALRRFRVGCIDQAEGGAIAVVEPVGQELDPVLVLYAEILEVGRGHIGGGGAHNIVPVHEDWHSLAPAGTGQLADILGQRRRIVHVGD